MGLFCFYLTKIFSFNIGLFMINLYLSCTSMAVCHFFGEIMALIASYCCLLHLKVHLITGEMSSNIRVNKICQYCKREFEARKTTSKTCSDNCAKKLYKQMQRGLKVSEANAETLRVKTKPLEEIKAKEFLSVKEVAKLLNCSLRTTYRLINNGNINAVNLSERKTIIMRKDIDKIFQQPDNGSLAASLPLGETDNYTLSEVQTKYNISEGALQAIIKRNGLLKEKKGWYTYVSKAEIDKIFK